MQEPIQKKRETATEIFSRLMQTDFTDPDNWLTRGKAIRWKCIDCMAGQQAEIRACTIKTCPLWPYRMGRGLKAHELETSGPSELENCSGEPVETPGSGEPVEAGPSELDKEAPSALDKIADGLD